VTEPRQFARAAGKRSSFPFRHVELKLGFGQLHLGAGGLYWGRFTCANTAIDDAEAALSQFERLFGQVKACLGPQRGVEGLYDVCTQTVHATVNSSCAAVCP
jgi:hypothetical protein